MKKTCFFLLSLSLLISCTTSDTDSVDQIVGEWTWIRSSGGLAGKTETPESTHKEIILKIDDRSIKQFVNGNLESNRTFQIDRRKSVIYGDTREMIIYNNGFRQIFSTAGNHLILSGDCNDCFQDEYQRN